VTKRLSSAGEAHVPSSRNYTDSGPLCASLYAANVAKSPGPGGWDHPGEGEADGHERLACGGQSARWRLVQVSSGAESRQMVGAGGESTAPLADCCDLCGCGWPCNDGGGRNAGTTVGSQIHQRGLWRDSLASSRQMNVTTSGLRWLVLAVVLNVPWTPYAMALPFLSLLVTTPKSVSSLANDTRRSHRSQDKWLVGCGVTYPIAPFTSSAMGRMPCSR